MSAPKPSVRPVRTHLRLITAGMVLAMTAACSGPPDPLDVSVKEVPSDIVLGSPESQAAVPAPVPPAVPILTGPGLPPSFFEGFVPNDSTPTTTSRGSTPSPPKDACPKVDPLASAKDQAMPTIASAPKPGVLPFRVDGTFSVSGANARQGRFPTTSTRTVAAVAATPSGFTYEIAAELAGTITTTGYQVIKQATTTSEAGIYVTFVATKAPSGATARFQPALPLKLVDLPIVPGTTLTAAGTDPNSATAVSWRSEVGQKRRVDACGVPLDSWTVNLTNGRSTSPSMDVEFTATYAIATQFGGLSIADTVVMQGREGLDTVSRSISSTINEAPSSS